MRKDAELAATRTSFRALTEAAFKNLSNEELRKLLEHNNIVVTDRSVPQVPLSVQGAATIGPVDKVRAFQGEKFPISPVIRFHPFLDQSVLFNPYKSNNRARVSTTLEVLKLMKLESPKSVNGLDYSMGHDDFARQPFSTESVAWEATKGGLYESHTDVLPWAAIRWGLFATAGCLTRWHADTGGFATFVAPDNGVKLWFVATPVNDVPLRDLMAHPKSHSMFDPNEVNNPGWFAEVVVLRPGMTL